MLGQLLDLLLGHAQVVQPLLADFLAGAIAHGLLHVVAGHVGEQAVEPHAHLSLGLGAELRLPVDGPGEQPAGVLHRHDAARHHTAGERVALADLLDVRQDLLIQRGHRGALPVALLRIAAELLGAAELRRLGRDLLPQIPAVAGGELGGEAGRGVLAAEGGVGHQAAGRDEDEVVFRERNGLLAARIGSRGRLAVFGQPLGGIDGRRIVLTHQSNLRGQLAVVVFGVVATEAHVGHMGVELEVHAVRLKVVHHRQDHGLVLVVPRETQGREIGQAAQMVHEAGDVALHLQCRVPILKGEHRAPVQPEVRVQHLIGEVLGDDLVLQLLLRGEEQVHDFHAGLVGQVELVVGMGVPAAILRGAAQRVVGVALVQPIVVVEHRYRRILDGGDVAEQIPHHLEVVVHLAAAAHGEAEPRVLPAIATAAGARVALQNVDLLAGHSAVAHKKARRSKSRQAAADNVGLLVFHALGRKRMGEGLVVAAGIVHSARPLWSGSMLTFHHAAAPRARIRQQDSVAPPLAGSNLAKRERPHYNGWL